ncbi:ATP-binding protein [Flavobacterium sp. HSC-61S13]|uniref:ATP-binding protein n=1 Tax=Flavobacterium sp. HSC-61S13 TaxID=2910963 RepID=UPI00209D299D|nr:ATP-binding protein [Flavobacterium sp. HSC-61S13]MCP1994380.1 ABC-type lipoprotein export system ATPase subunit [Flavobacterium sp. HSC-61S13]
MAKLKIKNFGPIKNGFDKNDGFIEIKKVTVFIGDQGSGKSTAAKLISIFYWLEKAFKKKQIKYKEKYILDDFIEYFEYQNISNYFVYNKKNNKLITELEFIGDFLYFHLVNNIISIRLNNDVEIEIPKIMYVPSDRNLISAVTNVRDLVGLPGTLYTFADEFFKAVKELKKDVTLPINDVKYRYNIKDNTSYLVGKEYTLNLTEASSGFQSTVPTFLVSSYLTSLVQKTKNKRYISQFNTKDFLSINDKERINIDYEESINKSITQKVNKLNLLNIELEQLRINIEKLSDLGRENELFPEYVRGNKLYEELDLIKTELNSLKNLKLKQDNHITNNFLYYSNFINIVEEPEQNLYPNSQHNILNSLLEFNNAIRENILIITTHSPYLLNFMSISIQASYLMNKISKNENSQKKEHLTKRVNNLVPIKSLVDTNDVVIYQIESNGSILDLEMPYGIPSDQNFLNQQLRLGNVVFDSLLEIEEELL